jgi:mannose-6-phosphate isomerase-like protein (cupin superfamily)
MSDGASGPYESIDLRRKFESFSDLWSPKVVADLNDYQVKVVRVKGDFVWHDHPDTDELFLVVEGSIRIDFPDGSVDIGEGELFVVPRGLRHKPYAPNEAKVVLIEPRGVVNTGAAGGALTAEPDVRI